MNVLDVINAYGAPAVCRAVSVYMSGHSFDNCVPELDECEFIGDMLVAMTVAHSALSKFEQAQHAQTLSELESLAVIENALIRKGQLSCP